MTVLPNTRFMSTRTCHASVRVMEEFLVSIISRVPRAVASYKNGQPEGYAPDIT